MQQENANLIGLTVVERLKRCMAYGVDGWMMAVDWGEG